MITVQDADDLILSECIDFGCEKIALEKAAGRILAEPLVADRAIPPFDRVTMDGIAIKYRSFEAGTKVFTIKAIQAAGEPPTNIEGDGDCIEIMTGAVLPSTADTVVRYEDIEIKKNKATIINGGIKEGQNIQYKGGEKKEGETILRAETIIGAAELIALASAGQTEVTVKKLPKAVIISTGNEVVPLATINPLPHQLRSSNAIAIQTLLAGNGLETDQLHLADELEIIKETLYSCLAKYEVIIITGGVSAGKFDLLPQALKECGVKEIFHKIAQRPGKPFWFGKNEKGVLVFGLPGNPVSSFLCTVRYVVPWLKKSIGIKEAYTPYARLKNDLSFTPSLQYFIPADCSVNEEGKVIATTISGNGSGDYLQLLRANSFIELPMNKEHFKKGEPYKIWPFRFSLL